MNGQQSAAVNKQEPHHITGAKLVRANRHTQVTDKFDTARLRIWMPVRRSLLIARPPVPDQYTVTWSRESLNSRGVLPRHCRQRRVLVIFTVNIVFRVGAAAEC